MTTTKPVREGFSTVTPYLIVPDVDKLVHFVSQAFGATEFSRTPGSAGGMHVEVKIGDSMVMIGGNPKNAPMPAMLYIYTHDVDGVYQRALDAGATSIAEPSVQDDGERRAGVKDVFGNLWYVGAPL